MGILLGTKLQQTQQIMNPLHNARNVLFFADLNSTYTLQKDYSHVSSYASTNNKGAAIPRRLNMV